MLTRKVYFCRLAALCSTDEKYKLVPAATGKDLHNNINIHARNTGKLATTLKQTLFSFLFFPLIVGPDNICLPCTDPLITHSACSVANECEAWINPFHGVVHSVRHPMFETQTFYSAGIMKATTSVRFALCCLYVMQYICLLCQKGLLFRRIIFPDHASAVRQPPTMFLFFSR